MKSKYFKNLEIGKVSIIYKSGDLFRSISFLVAVKCAYDNEVLYAIFIMLIVLWHELNTRIRYINE
jgi:hypothetical protein